MYCPNCGQQLPDDSNFCFKCGYSFAQINKDYSNLKYNPVEKRTTTYNNDLIDRNALLLYLRDLRDLEFAKNRIRTLYNQAINDYKCKCETMGTARYQVIPELHKFNFEDFIAKCGTVSFIAAAAYFIITLMVDLIKPKANVFEPGLSFNISHMIFTVFVAILAFYLWEIIKIYNKNSAIQGDINKRVVSNQKEEQRVNDNLNLLKQMKAEMDNRCEYLRGEFDKVSQILTDSYSINIIPSDYRNLGSIYYIYDYMSTSRESLSIALLQKHMENGIQQILERLDIIIEQNEQRILFDRIQLAQNQKLITQNVEKIGRLRQIESNTAVAAEYSELEHNYAKANAYFSLANYLKD